MGNRRVAKGGRLRRLATVAAFVAGVVVADSASAGSVTVAWDPNPEPDVIGYRVFVGTSPGTYTETFDVSATLTTFTYTAATNGVRYYFAVAAQAGEVIGTSSVEVSTDQVAPSGVSAGERLSPDAGVSSLLPERCREDCVSVLGAAAAEVSSLTTLPSGALLYVEGGERVVVQTGNSRGLVLQAAANEQLVEAVLDPQFASNGLAYVSVLRSRDAETMEMDIVRHRYVAGAFGEPATVVSGITVPVGRAAPFVVGDGGLLYVAAPANESRRDAYGSSVLVFDRDGATPRGSASPVVAAGFDSPSGLAWDSQRKRAWLAGQDQAGIAGVKVIRRTVDGQGAADARDAAMTEAAVTQHPIVDIAVRPNAEGLVVATDRDLVTLALDGSAPHRVDLEAYGTPIAVAVGAGGERYVAIRRRSAAGSGFVLLKISAGPQ
jgi:hypothetical protein